MLLNTNVTVDLLTSQQPTQASTPVPDLSNVDVSMSSLAGCSLINAKFNNATLIRANISNATLTGCDFNNANLNQADVSNSDMTDADFTNANLTGTTYNANTVWPTGFNPQAHGAVLVN